MGKKKPSKKTLTLQEEIICTILHIRNQQNAGGDTKFLQIPSNGREARSESTEAVGETSN